MKPLSIVADLDVVEQSSLGLGSGLEVRIVDQFGLERAEEALHWGIIDVIATAAH